MERPNEKQDLTPARGAVPLAQLSCAALAYLGDSVSFGGLLGYAPIIKLNEHSPEKFISRGGRIPASIHSLKN